MAILAGFGGEGVATALVYMSTTVIVRLMLLIPALVPEPRTKDELTTKRAGFGGGDQ